jgi:hypothetical protein
MLRKIELSPVRRAILAGYGIGLVVTFVWVPWRGYEVLKERGDPANLGYGLVWSPPEPPPSFIEYSSAVSKYVPVSGATLPAEPTGYISPFAYKTAAIDYGRVGLEFGALTALLLIAWVSPRVSPSK